MKRTLRQITLPLLLAISDEAKAQERPDTIPFHDLFRVEVRTYDGERSLNVEPEELKHDKVLGPQLKALSDFNAYLYENYSGMYRQEKELLALLPDEAALQKRFDELMDADTALQRIYMRALRKERVEPLQLDSALRIAAHFFYVHRMEGRVTMHVCIGINEVLEMSAAPSHPYHAAFCYMAIWGMKDKMDLFQEVVEPYRAEMRAGPTDERLREVEQLVYDILARDPRLRMAVLDEYERKAKYLNFDLVQ